MDLKYEYKKMKIDDLVLDTENPRFASSMLVKGNKNQITQELVIKHLLKYADIVKLANRINDVGELHGAELITCYKTSQDKYIVLEGNRRTCACKLLLNRALIPEEYKNKFPFLKKETKKNIEEITVVIYNNRKEVQPFLSDRHITGVKRWSALEKNNYYMNLFGIYKDINQIKNFTDDNLTIIKNSIRKYQFFMKVFNSLKEKYFGIEIEKLDYLPMVDKFMGILVGNDPEVGLNLKLDEVTQEYIIKERKEKEYNEILMKIGEAFLLRKEKRNCKEELSKIVSTEIKSFSEQKQLILDDERIPGLLKLIKEYKKLEENNFLLKKEIIEEKKENNNFKTEFETSASLNNEYNKSIAKEENDSLYSEENSDKNEKNDNLYRKENSNKNEENNDIKKEKHLKYSINSPLYLRFTQEEAKSFIFEKESDYGKKIRSLINDLADFNIKKHPYTCILLYRSLLEISTRLIYKKIKLEYNEDLSRAMNLINNQYIFLEGNTKENTKNKQAVKNAINTHIDCLNLYIHYPKEADFSLIWSSWNTLKYYIKECFDKKYMD